jgi:hypothetical protein
MLEGEELQRELDAVEESLKASEKLIDEKMAALQGDLEEHGLTVGYKVSHGPEGFRVDVLIQG